MGKSLVQERKAGRPSRQNGEVAAVLLAILFAFTLRVFRLDNQSMWWDEVFTGAVASLPFGELLKEILADRVHPPLYGVMMHAWIRIGFSAFILRYYSLLWGVLAVPFIYRLGRLVGGRQTGLTAALLLAISPFQIWYSQDARMYSMVATLVLASNWFLIRAAGQDKKRDWLGYALFLALSLYTHYLALFILLAHYGFFALNYRRHKTIFARWIKYAGGAAVSFSVWGLALMLTGGFEQAAISWVPPARWTHPFFTLLVFSAGATIDPTGVAGYLILSLFALSITAVLVTHSSRLSVNSAGRMYSQLLLAWLFLPMLLILLISLDLPIPQKRSIYMDRYLIILQPALLLLASWGLILLARRKGWLLPASLILLGLLTMPSLLNLYFDPAFARTDWKAAATQLQAEWQPQDKLIIEAGQVLPFLYYSSGELPYEVLPATDDSENHADGQEFETEIAPLVEAAATAGQRVWLIDTVANVDPHGFPQTRNDELARAARDNRLRRWMEASYGPGSEWASSGIALVVYETG